MSTARNIRSTKGNLQVIYEDNHIIIVNKRAGDIVQGDKTGDTTDDNTGDKTDKCHSTVEKRIRW